MKEGFPSDDDTQQEQPAFIGGDVYMEQVPSVEVPERKVVPGFIKEFSREHSQEERDTLAAEIRESRRGRDALRAEQGELGESKEKLTEDIDALKETIEKYNDASFLNKITDYFEYKKTKAEIDEMTSTLAGVESRMQNTEEEIPQFRETKKLIDDFYEGEKEKWAEAGHTPEDIAKQFSEEHLASLSVEDYATLMKRFPGEMVTHVTRQGIRDHAPMMYHTGGLGEFHDGFTGLLSSGRLHSSIGISLQEHNKEEAMAKFLKLDKIDDLLPNAQVSRREKALLMLSDKFSHNMAESNAFADTSAVHLAAETVADATYGAEKGNEIFFAFPSAYVASQLRFGRGHGALNRAYIDVDHEVENNQFIYTKDHEGMPLDAGLVFIPEDAQVDPETGSRYKINEHGDPIVPKQRMNEVLSARFEKKLGFVQVFVQKLPHQMKQVPEEDRAALAEDAFNKFGITDPDARKALLDPNLIDKLGDIWGDSEEGDKYEEILTKYFHENTENPYELAEHTMPSKEYWEKYFQEHPDQRPSKVVYYLGGDPSRALNEWREKNGIVKKTKDETFGFPEHQVANDSREANQGKDRFASLARKVIDDRFPEVPNEEEAESMAGY